MTTTRFPATDLPCFSERTFYMAELCAERERVWPCLEELAAVETKDLVESSKEELFFWD